MISKSISTVILLSAVLIKVPTVLSVVSSASVDGISLQSLMGEVLMFSNAAFYGLRQAYDFTAFGDAAIQLVGAYIMFFLYLHFTGALKAPGKVLPPMLGYASYLALVFVIIPQDYVHWLIRANYPMVVFTRGSQFWLNHKNGHTGAGSVLTIIMQALGERLPITR